MNEYEAEHLLSLEVSDSERGAFAPEKAIIRLHQLDLTKCLSPKKVYLRLDSTELLIMDQKAGSVEEKLPYSCVIPCQEVYVRSVNDKFPNLVVLTIKDSFEIVPDEFYIFQFANTSAIAKGFVQKLTQLKESSQQIPNKNKLPVLGKPSKDEVARKILEDQIRDTAQATLRYKSPPERINSSIIPFSVGSSGAGSTYSTGLDVQMLDKYLDLLNRCLDDIEKFVLKLQQVSKAYQELEEKRRMRPGYPTYEDSALLMSARPPHPREFCDIFQKIKLSLNLLAKLRGRINNPNAPEMVHFLFNPLDLIVEASCAVISRNDQPLWEQAISPLLNPETISFLEDCLGTQEMDLWHFLGSTWNMSSADRDFWLSSFPEISMYVPVFSDGWSPPISILVDISPRIEPRSVSHQYQQPQRIFFPSYDANNLKPDTPPFKPIENQHSGLVSRRSNSPNLVRSSASSPIWSPSVSQYPQLSEDQLSRVYQEETRAQDPQKEFVAQLIAKGSRIYVTTCDRRAENSRELSVTKGQALEVMETTRLSAKVRSYDGIIGYVPMSILTPLGLNTTNNNNPGNRGSIYDMTPDGQPRQRNAIDILNEEFQRKISADPETSKKKVQHRNSIQLSTGIITEKSTPEEINSWLCQKGFGENVQSVLQSFGGKQLFMTDKSILEKLFGIDDGSRLYSQILVQRNLSGYKTYRAKELNAILEQRKKKSDGMPLAGSNLYKMDNGSQDQIPLQVGGNYYKSTSEHF